MAIKHKTWRALATLTERQRALAEVAEKLSATPTRMLERDWQPLRTLGFGDHACLEVAHIVGIFNYLTRLADGLGLELDAGTRAAAASGVALRRGPAAQGTVTERASRAGAGQFSKIRPIPAFAITAISRSKPLVMRMFDQALSFGGQVVDAER